MGFLEVHTLCTWDEGRQYVAYIKRHAALEFLELMRVHRHRQDACDRMWGDELEFMIIKGDKLLLEAHHVIDFLSQQVTYPLHAFLCALHEECHVMPLFDPNLNGLEPQGSIRMAVHRRSRGVSPTGPPPRPK